MKYYYLFLLVMFFLMSCERTDNVSESRVIGQLEGWGPIIEITVDDHDYINITKGFTHSGNCRKCKREKDSISNLIIQNKQYENN